METKIGEIKMETPMEIGIKVTEMEDSMETKMMEIEMEMKMAMRIKVIGMEM